MKKQKTIMIDGPNAWPSYTPSKEVLEKAKKAKAKKPRKKPAKKPS